MDVWKRTILKTINACNGEASYAAICKNAGNFIKLREKDFTETKSGIPAYWAPIKLHIYYLCKFGDINERSKKLYQLTEQGKKRISEENYTWEYVKKDTKDIIEI